MVTKAGARIKKANGEFELFDERKLFESLVNSGADEALAERVTSYIADNLHDGDRTQDIYTRAFAKLRAIERPMAARYSVKRALLELGPSGYPFEDFIAEIYKALGYTPKTRTMVHGRCVEHEMDLIAARPNEQLGAEIKYHNNAGLRSDLKVALYVHARFLDLAAVPHTPQNPRFTKRMLITNTKFSEQAEVYAACVGLDLLSWDYPRNGNLRHLIEDTHVHPLSCLTTLSSAQKRRLMEQGIVLCRHVKEHVDELERMGLTEKTIQDVMGEIKSLCLRQ